MCLQSLPWLFIWQTVRWDIVLVLLGAVITGIRKYLEGSVCLLARTNLHRQTTSHSLALASLTHWHCTRTYNFSVYSHTSLRLISPLTSFAVEEIADGRDHRYLVADCLNNSFPLHTYHFVIPHNTFVHFPSRVWLKVRLRSLISVSVVIP